MSPFFFHGNKHISIFFMKRNTFPEKPTTLSNFPFSFGLGGTCLLQIYLAGTSFLDPPIYFIFSLLIEKKNLDQKDLYIYILYREN